MLTDVLIDTIQLWQYLLYNYSKQEIKFLLCINLTFGSIMLPNSSALEH